MKRLLFFLFLPSLSWGSAIFIPSGINLFIGTVPPGSTNYIQNTLSPTTTTQAFNVQKGVITDTATLSYLSGTQCLHTVNGAVLGTGSDCGSGGGGGSDNLGNGVGSFGVATTTGGFTGAVTIAGVNVNTQFSSVATDTTSLRTSLNSTAVSTGTLQTQANAIAVATGTLALNFPVSLSSNTMGTLQPAQYPTTFPTSVLPSTVAFITSTQTFSGQNTFTATVVISTTIGLSSAGGTGTSGQVLTSQGPGTTPIWNTPSAGGGGGSGFSLVITTGGPTSYIGPPISSFSTTTTILFDSNTVQGSLISANTFFFQLTSSVTKQGNAFNGASQLVQLNGSTQLPAVSGALLTNLTGSAIVSGIPTAVLPSTIAYTTTVNTFNSSQTVTAVQGSSVTWGVYAGTITAGNLAASGNICSSNGLETTSGCANGTLTANQTITLSGDTSGTGSTAVTTTLAGAIANQHTWSGTGTFTSSVTMTAPLGFGVTFGVTASTLTLVNALSTTTLSVSTSATGVTQLAVSSNPAVNPTDPILSISSTSGTTILWIDNAGNLISSGTATTVSSCGSSPSVAGNNIAGQITVGGGVVTACTLTFANGGFVNAPICVPSDNSATVSVSNGATSGTSAVFNLSATLGGGLINYICFGLQK